MGYNLTDIGSMVKGARKLTKLSVAQLADLVGESKGIIYKIEKGDSSVILYKFLKVLDILPIYFTNKKPNTSDLFLISPKPKIKKQIRKAKFSGKSMLTSKLKSLSVGETVCYKEEDFGVKCTTMKEIVYIVKKSTSLNFITKMRHHVNSGEKIAISITRTQ